MSHCHALQEVQSLSLPYSWHPDVMIGGVALRALLIRWHLERGAQPPCMRSEQRLMKSVWWAECWKELQGRMSMWASLCPPVCPSTVSLPLDLPLRVLKRVIVWHHLYAMTSRKRRKNNSAGNGLSKLDLTDTEIIGSWLCNMPFK